MIAGFLSYSRHQEESHKKAGQETTSMAKCVELCEDGEVLLTNKQEKTQDYEHNYHYNHHASHLG